MSHLLCYVLLFPFVEFHIYSVHVHPYDCDLSLTKLFGFQSIKTLSEEERYRRSCNLNFIQTGNHMFGSIQTLPIILYSVSAF
ncbi:hypothetical protein GLYMA_01G211551v4 [Glycine max]|nr:hypothetical protein GLYMA_01G211551v4 [Glycine max]KAH1164188.1 hypothetical protein GYH30_002292 [Glycine max]